MTDDICGEPTKDGAKCQRTAGWGTDHKGDGPCIDHEQERPVLRKFTPERRERIVGAASSGAFKKHIAQLAEIDPDTLDRWIQMGKEDEINGLDTELAQFYTDWQRARGAGVLRKLNNASDEFILERAYGYTKTQEIEHSGDAPGGLFNIPDDVAEKWEKVTPDED